MNQESKTLNPAVKWVEIKDDHCGQRLDNFLVSYLKGVPKSLIYKIIRKGEVRVNKGRSKPTSKLKVGDVVRIPPIRTSEHSNKEGVPKGPSKTLLEQLPYWSVFDDEGLLVMNKPSGIAVHGGSGISFGLIELLRYSDSGHNYLELIHRLDRDTSGLIMLARKRSALLHVQREIQQKNVDKVYHALVKGRWPAGCSQINVPLLKNELKSGERVVKAHKDGKSSLTQFKVLRRFKDATLIEARPVTGRTHQIRVHSQFAGHPIIGDEKYCDDETNQFFKNLGVRRLFLHAAELRLKLPNSQKLACIKAPLEGSLVEALEHLQDINR